MAQKGIGREGERVREPVVVALLTENGRETGESRNGFGCETLLERGSYREARAQRGAKNQKETEKAHQDRG